MFMVKGGRVVSQHPDRLFFARRKVDQVPQADGVIHSVQHSLLSSCYDVIYVIRLMAQPRPSDPQWQTAAVMLAPALLTGTRDRLAVDWAALQPVLQEPPHYCPAVVSSEWLWQEMLRQLARRGMTVTSTQMTNTTRLLMVMVMIMIDQPHHPTSGVAYLKYSQ